MKTLTENKISWLARRIADIFAFPYTSSQVYEALTPLLEDDNVIRYNYLASLMHKNEKELLIKELNLCQIKN